MNFSTSSTLDRKALEQLCINTIRTLSMDAVQKANSGHPGAPMGLAPLAHQLTRAREHLDAAEFQDIFLVLHIWGNARAGTDQLPDKP